MARSGRSAAQVTPAPDALLNPDSNILAQWKRGQQNDKLRLTAEFHEYRSGGDTVTENAARLNNTDNNTVKRRRPLLFCVAAKFQ
ncbi:hypothetical protein GCM10010981_19160 [Dyella nitratireducens]|uniref:Uncharacterized protein n=1 Tax=Dyella nitratireducens TaxID=1849580 RepID=A0ABQ1FTL5_9GAMM|nr:hypothetical protein GCM10010981_19160 [Dyella nitratireducens]GLQ43020.1 hypothetical protein GCM10007902_28700 [Dyella nitratireducens]